MVKKKEDMTEAFKVAVQALSLPPDEEIARIADLAKRQVALEQEEADKEAALADVQGRLREVQEKLLPELLLGHGLTELKLATGEKITVIKSIAVSIPKDKAEATFAWLEKAGFGAIVKYSLSVEGLKGDVKKFEAGQKALEKLGLITKAGKGVHPQTLKAFASEQLEKAKPLPEEFFSVFSLNRTKITTL